MNNLYQQLQRQQTQLQQPLNNNQKLYPQQFSKNNLLSNFLKSSNPKEFIDTMAMNNPKMQNVLQLFQNSNLTPKQFFYQYANQNGIDPDQFIGSLTGGH